MHYGCEYYVRVNIVSITMKEAALDNRANYFLAGAVLVSFFFVSPSRSMND